MLFMLTETPSTNLEDHSANDSGTDCTIFWRRLLRWKHLPLLIIIIFTLALHFSFIMTPKTLVGDEKYYIEDARLIIDESFDKIPEHPPLAKLFIISGIRIFGDNQIGWRFFSVIFGTIAIILFYLICRKLKISNKAVVFATFLFALDDMFFVHASLGWLDIYMLTFMLAGFLLYLHEAYFPMVIAIALSTLCKLSGGLGALAIGLHWLITGRNNIKQVIAAVIYTIPFFLLFMTIFEFFIQGIIVDPVQRTIETLQLTASFTFSTWFSAVRPWMWIFPHKIFSYSYPGIQYLSFISWTIQILIIPVVIYMIYKAIHGSKAAWFVITWFVSTYLIWIPVNLITDRITYDFYFLQTTGAICIGIGIALSGIIDKLKAKTIRLGKLTAGIKTAYAGIGLYLFLHLVIFIIANPVLPDYMKEWLKPIIN